MQHERCPGSHLHWYPRLMHIDVRLVKRLVARQFPQWAALPISPVAVSGWDNRTFHLGDELSVRLPSAEAYARAVHREQQWLPRLAPHLPLPIPQPVAMGEPGEGYPWHWSIYRWLPGAVATRDNVSSLSAFATDLARFLRALQSVDPTGGPGRKLRGGSLERWRPQAEASLAALSRARSIDTDAATAIWKAATEARFESEAVWFHGDVAAGNLLVSDGRLSAVIDFGGLGVGDPACDMTIAWTLFDAASRRAFRRTVGVSDAIWNRGKGWALWKAMIVVSGMIETNALEAASSGYAIDQLTADYRNGE